ncbi:uncharacterized protein LOC129730681 [Wyeomyia smithii]|uniref:uncharacterized protein LOC129730681 n=1 Tax=Wyeomyia smithii TaxID=174621 RepID=UPI00246820D8|nr:uncharacterized protein LOC129730681 [Wyeomyia smithii]
MLSRYSRQAPKQSIYFTKFTISITNLKTSRYILKTRVRKSAYDVYAPGILAAALQAASLNEPEKCGSRRPSYKIPITDNSLETEELSSPDRVQQSALIVDDERRNKRRGSQLPDISALRNNQNSANIPIYQCPALEDLEAPRRQTSLDGEAIKIVIHDVDSGPLFASKRRVILQKDPADKAHRTRGFGMRVVGGKAGADGKLFAYIAWTVPGGPAEKGGLQQGDKILEWCGASLVDRSFEEVCAIMDRTGDVIELLVEHATDFRMCDLLDDGTSGNTNNQMKSNTEMSNLGFSSENETITDKSPSSPTRRKLPKTPVIAARNLIPIGIETTPDTYVKSYLKDGDRLRHKKKTKVVKYAIEPQYNQVLKYTAAELFGRKIVITVWQKSVGFDHNQSIGGAELFFNTYKMKSLVQSWYPLFPFQDVTSNLNDSP